MSRFPAYQTAGIAARWGCFSCCTKLEPRSVQDMGYPSGSGQYGMKCHKCHSWTFFDLTLPTPSLGVKNAPKPV